MYRLVRICIGEPKLWICNSATRIPKVITDPNHCNSDLAGVNNLERLSWKKIGKQVFYCCIMQAISDKETINSVRGKADYMARDKQLTTGEE
jgi:hypothetical protein